MKTKKIVAVVGSVFFPLVALAAGPIIPKTPPLTKLDEIKDTLLCGVLNWLFTAAVILTVGSIIWAAIGYIKSEGGEEVSASHKAVTYTIVGIAVAILAKGVPILVSSFLNNGTATIGSNDICPSR